MPEAVGYDVTVTDKKTAFALIRDEDGGQAGGHSWFFAYN